MHPAHQHHIRFDLAHIRGGPVSVGKVSEPRGQHAGPRTQQPNFAAADDINNSSIGIRQRQAGIYHHQLQTQPGDAKAMAAANKQPLWVLQKRLCTVTKANTAKHAGNTSCVRRKASVGTHLNQKDSRHSAHERQDARDEALYHKLYIGLKHRGRSSGSTSTSKGRVTILWRRQTSRILRVIGVI